jgi:hypothetical protein
MHSPGRNMVAIRAHMACSQGACACAGGPGAVRAGPQHQQGPLGHALAEGGHEVRFHIAHCGISLRLLPIVNVATCKQTYYMLSPD